jgi:hypothetical protein
VVRILRATARIVIYLNDGLELMEPFLSLLNHTELDYERYLCVEGIHIMCSNPEVMKILNERHISTASVPSFVLILLLVLHRNFE